MDIFASTYWIYAKYYEKLNDVMKNQKRVLVVDDDPATQFFLWESLSKINKNIEVDFVDNVKDSVTKLKSKEYELVIVDILLRGEKTGFDLWEYCQKESISSPFIFISGTQSRKFHDFFVGRFERIPRFLHKPITPYQLQKVVEVETGWAA